MKALSADMCRTAPAGLALWDELNRRHPRRNRETDGACPNPDHHDRNPDSDHEPWVNGISCALDTTHDPANGIDAHGALAEELKDDHRVKYAVRFNERLGHDEIWNNELGDTHWRNNSSGDEHRSHLHLSFWHNLAVLNDTRGWLGTSRPHNEGIDSMSPEEVKLVVQAAVAELLTGPGELNQKVRDQIRTTTKNGTVELLGGEDNVQKFRRLVERTK